jgi:hypothetical protein
MSTGRSSPTKVSDMLLELSDNSADRIKVKSEEVKHSSPSLKNKISAVEKEIAQTIKRVDAEIRSDYPILKHQDAIGTILFTVSAAMVLATWWVHVNFGGNSVAVSVACIASVAFFVSILHELEHDLIHNIYFAKNPLVQGIMFAFIWVFKISASPWWRKKMHLKHHMHSGQKQDAEERIIGLGLPAGLKKMMVTMHPYGAVLVSRQVSKDSWYLNLFEMVNSSAPIIATVIVLNKVFFAYLLAMWFYGDEWTQHLPQGALWYLKEFHILVWLPNIFRQSCLVLMSTFSHYYEDIPIKSVFFQNQVLDHWMLFPFQFFCSNFGATHILHHYVPSQPFYIRQMTYDRGVKEEMIRLGVRYNDFGSLARANRFFGDKIGFSQQETMSTVQEFTALETTSSDIATMAYFITMCYTLGIASYVLYDFIILLEFPLNVIHHFTTSKTSTPVGMKEE